MDCLGARLRARRADIGCLGAIRDHMWCEREKRPKKREREAEGNLFKYVKKSSEGDEV